MDGSTLQLDCEMTAVTNATKTQLDIEVRYAETDQMGVVHHANYLVWFELVRTALYKQSGYHYAEIEDLGFLMMVTNAEVSYQRGIRYADTVSVSCWIEAMRSRTIHFAYQIERSGEIAATGRTEHVWIDRASRRPCRMPPILEEPFARLAGNHS